MDESQKLSRLGLVLCTMVWCGVMGGGCGVVVHCGMVWGDGVVVVVLLLLLWCCCGVGMVRGDGVVVVVVPLSLWWYCGSAGRVWGDGVVVVVILVVVVVCAVVWGRVMGWWLVLLHF